MWKSKRVRKILDVIYDVLTAVLFNVPALVVGIQILQHNLVSEEFRHNVIAALGFMVLSTVSTIMIIVQKHHRIPRSEMVKRLEAAEAKNASAVADNK